MFYYSFIAFDSVEVSIASQFFSHDYICRVVSWEPMMRKLVIFSNTPLCKCCFPPVQLGNGIVLLNKRLFSCIM